MGKNILRQQSNAMRAAHKGQTPWNKGEHLSDETKLRMSLAQTGELNHNFGKKHKAETIEKMRLAQLGRHASEETKIKMSAAQRGHKRRAGKTHSNAIKELMAKMRAGQPWSQRRPSAEKAT
jgi:hypothetical protein